MKLPLSSRTTLWWLVALLGFAAWVGMRGLDADSFWLDEIWSVRQAHLASPLDVWNVIATQDPWQAPGYYMLLSTWGEVAGWSEFAVRSLSLFAGLIGIAFTWRLARDLMSPQGALAAAVALGASAYYLYFFHEARAYTFCVLLTPMMVWSYRRFALSGRWPFAFLLGVAMTGALYIHYFAALTAVLLGVFHLSLGLRWLGNSRRWWLLTGIFALCALLFLPWLDVMLRGIAQAGTELGVRGANALTSEQMIRGSLFLFSNGSTALMMLALIFAVRRTRRAVLTWAWCLGLTGVLLVINALLGVILEIRYMLALWPVFALLVGMGLERLGQNRLSVFGAFLGIWVAAGLWMSLSPEAAVALRNPHWYLPWREWHAVLQDRAGDEDLTLVMLPDWTWAVYHEGGLSYYLDSLPGEAALVARPENSPVSYPTQIPVTDSIRRLWFLYDHSQPYDRPTLAMEYVSEEGFIPCSVVPYRFASAELWVRVPDAQQAPVAIFGAQSEMRAYWVEGGTGADLTLIWNNAEGIPSSLSAGVYLENSNGVIVAQADAGIPQTLPACVYYRLSLPENTAAEPLVQSLAVYDWMTGDRIGAVSGARGLTEDGRAILRLIHDDE